MTQRIQPCAQGDTEKFSLSTNLLYIEGRSTQTHDIILLAHEIQFRTSQIMDYNIETVNWDSFHNTFHLRADTVTLYTEEVQDRCSRALSASNIRHPPITARIKSWESARGSISRRNRERVIRRRIRDLVESQGRRWDDYAHEAGFGLYGEETEPFKGPDEMFSALHDFGGVRISLYFPGDVEKVAGIIDKQFQVIRRIEKGHVTQSSVRSLEERLELLQNPMRSMQATVDSRILQQSMRTFTGYKASHFVVKLRDEHIKEHQKVAWKDIVVEIQVGTPVMHVWSEIEHDMIYKPLDSQDGEVSEDEKRILDLINGIVLTGEAALRQLEASTAQRLNKRAEDENAMASSHYELATWIEKHLNQHKKSSIGSEWRHLERLFTILKVTGSHKHSEVIKLIDKAVKWTLSRYFLPMQMLFEFIKSPVSSDFPLLLNNLASESDLARDARFLALHLVHSMNLATHFGIIQGFLDLYSGNSNQDMPWHHRPTIASFLDILHPEQPQYSDKETVLKIIDFCKKIVRPENRKWPRSEKLEWLLQTLNVILNLPMTHLVAGFTEGVSRTIPIPALITHLLPFEEMNETQKYSLDNTYDFFEAVDFIDLSMFSGDCWDDLMDEQDYIKEQPIDSTDIQSIRTHCFVPIMHCNDSSFGRWKLLDQSLKIEKMNAEDIRGSTKSPTKTRPESKDSDSILRLVYRLYSDQERGRIREKWELIMPPNRNMKRKRLRSD